MTADCSKSGNTSPIISVIVPVYNTPAQFLNECIESVLVQDFHLFELILVDDGSDLPTASLLDRLSQTDDRIQLLTTPNRGVSMARNAGLDIARGQYITFLDSDDCLLPGALSQLYATALNNRVKIATGGIIFENESPAREDRAVTVLPSLEAIEKLFRQRDYNWNVGPCAKLFDRSLFDDLRFSSNRYEDLELIPQIFAQVDSIACDPTPVYFYRQHPAAFTHTFSPSRLDVLDVMDRLRQTVGNLSSATDRALDDRTFSAACHVTSLLAREDKDKKYTGQADRAWTIVRKYRCQILLDPKARPKNRIGALIALLGRHAFTAIARLTTI